MSLHIRLDAPNRGVHGSAMPTAHQLVGRERELLALAAFLDAREQLPAAILIQGEAGIGKTTLWRAAVDAAKARSYRVIEARPALAEATLAFAALGDLLGTHLEDALRALPEPQRRALEAALLLRSPEGSLDQRAIGVAFLGAIRGLANDGPLLIAVDDIQWLDRASAATVVFALRRLRAEPIAVLLARRIGSDGSHSTSVDFGLETTRLDMGPLSLGAIHALVFARFDMVVPRRTLRRLHELSRGNPFYALELARGWQAGTLRLEPGESVPPDLEALLGARVAALPGAARRTLAFAAALSHPTVPTLEEAQGTRLGTALDRAVSEHIVEVAGDDVRFAHPLLAASAYAGVTSTERRGIHGRLAEVVTEPEERARHLGLATTEPDEAVAREVETAALSAFRRGAPASAADLIALALRMTPATSESDRARRSLAEADYRFEAGETEVAMETLEGLIARAEPGRQRAGLLARQARFHHFGQDVSGGVALLREALRDAGEDPRLRVQIEEGLTWGLLLMREDLPAAAAHARSAVRYAEELGDDAALAEALAAQALADAVLGREAMSTMKRALALEPATFGLRVLRHPSFAYGYLLTVHDRLDEARQVFLELGRRAGERGDESALPPIDMQLCLIEFLAGNWARAEELADEAYAAAVQAGQRPSQAAALARKALVEAHRGKADGARETAMRSVELAAGPGFDSAAPRAALARGGELAIWALGHLCLSLEDHAGAHRHLRPLCDALLEAGIAELGEVRALPDEIEALIGLGRLEDAERNVGRLENMAEGRERRSVTAAALRSRALLAAASGDTPAAITAAEGACAHARVIGLPFELGRALLVLGTTQRRARLKRQARESLDESLAIFERLGAGIWMGRVRAELGRIGGRAPAGGKLTPTELRAAELVALGRSNKEVAAALFVSTKTVEANLSRIYAKLGVQSRMELARLLAEERAGSKPQGHS